jgi:hypothetical protein
VIRNAVGNPDLSPSRNYVATIVVVDVIAIFLVNLQDYSNYFDSGVFLLTEFLRDSFWSMHETPWIRFTIVAVFICTVVPWLVANEELNKVERFNFRSIPEISVRASRDFWDHLYEEQYARRNYNDWPGGSFSFFGHYVGVVTTILMVGTFLFLAGSPHFPVFPEGDIPIVFTEMCIVSGVNGLLCLRYVSTVKRQLFTHYQRIIRLCSMTLPIADCAKYHSDDETARFFAVRGDTPCFYVVWRHLDLAFEYSGDSSDDAPRQVSLDSLRIDIEVDSTDFADWIKQSYRLS